MLCLGALIACSPSKKGLEPTSEQGSPRERLIENLRAIPQKGIMFGHHDDLHEAARRLVERRSGDTDVEHDDIALGRVFG